MPAFEELALLAVMHAAQKLDGEGANVVHRVRVLYGAVQCVCLLLAAYVYVQASSMAKGMPKNKIYVPLRAEPFGDPNAKKEYLETTYQAHVNRVARSKLVWTFFDALVVAGLHCYTGNAAILFFQAVMDPVVLFKNALVRAMLIFKGVRPSGRIFNEKLAHELLVDLIEVVDERGASISVPAIVATAGSKTD